MLHIVTIKCFLQEFKKELVYFSLVLFLRFFVFVFFLFSLTQYLDGSPKGTRV